MFSIVILYNRSNQFGLKKDADVLESTFRSIGQTTITHRDPLEPPQACDICIHLEQPIHMWMSWARYNILIVNPEWYVPSAYNAYLPKFDKILFKNTNALGRFTANLPISDKAVLIPWAMGDWDVKDLEDIKWGKEPGLGFVAFLGASQNRHSFIAKFLRFWRESYPQLNIFTTGNFDLSGNLPSNVIVHKGDLTEAQRYKFAAFFPGHIIVSESEGFSYTAAEAEAVGAFTILNTIEAFSCQYNGAQGVGFFPITQERTDAKHSLAMMAQLPDSDTAQTALDSIIKKFISTDIESLRNLRKAEGRARKETFAKAWKDFFASVTLAPKFVCPPLLPIDECPPISVVTLIYNRKKFFDLACHTIMIQDYPKDKIEWIIVDDSDDPEEQNSDRIIQVQNNAAPLKIVYVPLTHKKVPVSNKRNIGCRKASNNIILMMDDDDHYPETSFRRRVGWLTQHPWKPQATSCTTIACYDLVKGISAVNAPPLDIPLSERISEATLTFYKSWWETREFTKQIQVGEGETFVFGREQEFLEMPPQQIIVAFSHGRNTSSRRVPEGADVKPGCFWGFPREFLIFIHKLAGIEVKAA